MYCSSCGTFNDDNNFRCIQCGTVLQNVGPTPGAMGAGYYAQQTYAEPNKADTALIFAILGWVVCGVMAIPGFFMARDEVRSIESGNRNPSKLSTAKAAYWLALIQLILFGIGLVGVGVFVLFAGVAGNL